MFTNLFLVLCPRCTETEKRHDLHKSLIIRMHNSSILVPNNSVSTLHGGLYTLSVSRDLVGLAFNSLSGFRSLRVIGE